MSISTTPPCPPEGATRDNFPAGSLVEAHGLTGAVNLNGKRGVANGRIQGSRVGINFPDPDGTKALTAERLLLVREGAEDAPMPQRFPAPQPARAERPTRRRVLAYGDSLTAGYRLNGFRFSPYGLFLAGALAGSDSVVDVWVCGLSGMTAKELADGLDKPSLRDAVGRTGKGLCRVLMEHGPFDLAVIMVGTNDIGLSPAEPRAIVADIVKLHEACHQEGVCTVALAVPPSGAMREHERYRDRWLEVNRELRELGGSKVTAGGATGHVALFVDTGSLVRFEGEDGGCLWERDRLHLSEVGSRALGEGLAPLLAKLIVAASLRCSDDNNDHAADCSATKGREGKVAMGEV